MTTLILPRVHRLGTRETSGCVCNQSTWSICKSGFRSSAISCKCLHVFWSRMICAVCACVVVCACAGGNDNGPEVKARKLDAVCVENSAFTSASFHCLSMLELGRSWRRIS
jgi:hypothetical protein